MVVRKGIGEERHEERGWGEGIMKVRNARRMEGKMEEGRGKRRRTRRRKGVKERKNWKEERE